MSDGTGRIYRRGDVWWLDYGFRGERHRESSGSHRKGDAVALLRKRLSEMGRGRLVGPREESVTFEDLARIITDDYRVNGRKSLDRLEDSLQNLRRYFALQRALDITTATIKSYIRARQEEGAANGTIRNELNALRRAFNLALRAEVLTRVPYVPSVKLDNVRTNFLDGADLEAVIAQLPEDLRPVVAFAALTGWRKAEVLALEWAQVDFEQGVVQLLPGTTKTGEGREFPFRALPALERLLVEQRERTDAVERHAGRIVSAVFHRAGEPIRSLRKAWEGACERAGLQGAWFHDLRRTAIRNMERAGVSRSVAMKLSGHRTASIYNRYAIADSTALDEGVQKLAAFHSDRGEGRTILPINGTKTAQSGERGGG